CLHRLQEEDFCPFSVKRHKAGGRFQNNSLIEENQQLRGQKRKAELDLATERLEEKAARMQKKDKEVQKKEKIHRLPNIARQGKGEDLKKTATLFAILQAHDFIATKVYETISWVEEGELQLQKTEPKELTDSDIDGINMWRAYLKDKFYTSNESWHELTIKCKDMSTKYKICKHLVHQGRQKDYKFLSKRVLRNR
ncbi:hypothetical protein pdam_00015435, partial [Pocillopora damicornis]